MASDYGLNFGFRRSDESVRVSEGRFKTPASGSVLLQGTAVEIHPTSPGYLRVAAANRAPRTGVCGLLIQEEFDRSIYQSESIDSFEMGKTKQNRLSVITNGAGTKIWLKNTAGSTRADGRVIAAVQLVHFTLDGAGSATTLAVGDQLGWTGTEWRKVDGVTLTAANAHMEITQVNATALYLEAVLLK